MKSDTIYMLILCIVTTLWILLLIWLGSLTFTKVIESDEIRRSLNVPSPS